MRKSSEKRDTRAKVNPAIGHIAIHLELNALICLRINKTAKTNQALIEETKRISAKRVRSPLLIIIPSIIPMLKARKPQSEPCQLILSKVPRAGKRAMIDVKSFVFR